MDTIFTISGIFFLYNFLVGLSGKTINGVHGARHVLHHPKTLQKNKGGEAWVRHFGIIFYSWLFLILKYVRGNRSDVCNCLTSYNFSLS
jgi:hypothetical protein